MRWDDEGLLWQDIKVEKPKKEPKPKREPPPAVWLNDDYLPWLEEARAYRIDRMTWPEMQRAIRFREPLVWDLEIYPNYFLGGFKSINSGKIYGFEVDPKTGIDRLNKQQCKDFTDILQKGFLIGFNSISFDLPIAHAAIKSYTCLQLMECVNELIIERMTPRDFYRKHRITPIKDPQSRRPNQQIDHIDLIELTALSPSLKISAGRLHAPLMQDLPFQPGKMLTPEQIITLRWYWANDLSNTELLYHHRKPEIELRAIIGARYNVEVRSKSDPQIAEAVIRQEIKRLKPDIEFKPAQIDVGRSFKYNPPSYLRYFTPMMQQMLEFVKSQEFVIDMYGGPLMPSGLKELHVKIGLATYNLGIGGLHSQEKRAVHYSDDEYEITDNDVTSYYPTLILQQQMYPPHVGKEFLTVFKDIYDQRLMAKAKGDKTTAETLKIALNGTFGKTGERGGHSVVYHPEMMIGTTVTGQLLLLWLIEALELNEIEVISANTDGIMIKCHRSKLELKSQILKWWEQVTHLELEATHYHAVYLRDVNNYVAVLRDQTEKKYAKTKGAYALASEPTLKKNPSCDICIQAVIKHLASQTPIEQTIAECRDLRQFVEVRRVNGGACKNGEYLGKAVRWYYSVGEEQTIICAKNGHDVPRSKGARPCMRMPETFPADLDFDYYIRRAYDIMADLFPKREEDQIADAA